MHQLVDPPTEVKVSQGGGALPRPRRVHRGRQTTNTSRRVLRHVCVCHAMYIIWPLSEVVDFYKPTFLDWGIEVQYTICLYYTGWLTDTECTVGAQKGFANLFKQVPGRGSWGKGITNLIAFEGIVLLIRNEEWRVQSHYLGDRMCNALPSSVCPIVSLNNVFQEMGTLSCGWQ